VPESDKARERISKNTPRMVWILSTNTTSKEDDMNDPMMYKYEDHCLGKTEELIIKLKQQLTDKQAEHKITQELLKGYMDSNFERQFEIEKLQAEVDELKKLKGTVGFITINERCDQLEQQLKERDAMIIEAREICKLVTEDTSYALVYARMFLDKTKDIK
jgi:hypothetical protein